MNRMRRAYRRPSKTTFNFLLEQKKKLKSYSNGEFDPGSG